MKRSKSLLSSTSLGSTPRPAAPSEPLSISLGLEAGKVTSLSVRDEALGRSYDMAEMIQRVDTDLDQTRKAEVDALVRAAFHGVEIVLDPSVLPGKYRIHMSQELYDTIRRTGSRGYPG